MFQIALITLFNFKIYSIVMGLPSPNNPPSPSHTLRIAPITTLSSILTQISTTRSNGTIVIPAPAATKPTSSTLMVIPPSYAMNSLSPNSVSKPESQPKWSPADFCTILFGCIGSVLGVLYLWLTFWRGRQRFILIIKDGFQDELQLQSLP